MAVVCTACELPGVVHRDSAFATDYMACHPGANGRGDALRAGQVQDRRAPQLERRLVEHAS